ncbi:MAG TPA: tetratricopeptide repeat protein, partial [Candidatus Nitrosotenuis sp.]|nr:tetratricopeptide repeat protein [Candidatus Nitrosotenuis sp.]
LYLLTRRLFGPRAALWGTALWAASAMFWLNSGSYTSHPAALFLALLMLYFHSRTLARPRPGDWVLASLAAAALTLTRQQEVPGPLVGAVALAWAQGRRGWRAFLKAPVLNLAAGVALGLLLTLWVNAHQTGDPFRLAVDVTQHHAGYGFGVQQHDLPRALWNLAFSLARLTLWLPVGFLGLSLWGLGPPNRRALALVLAAGAQILVYMGFFTQGRLEYGARYYFLTAGLLAPLAGRGLARVEAWLARRRGLGPRAVLVPAALLGFSVAMQLALVLRVEAEVRAGLEPLQRIHRFLASRPGPTLVLVRSAPRGEARALIRVGPRLDDRDLFAVYLDPAENQRLVQAHPRRQAFLLDYRQGAFSLTPYRFREPGAEDYLWAGVNYLQSLGQPARAAPMLERAVQLDPAASRAWALLGYCYRYAGDLPSALKAWRRALDLDPRMHQVRFDLAEALWEAGQPRAARQEWEAVAREAADGPLVRQARERLLR